MMSFLMLVQVLVEIEGEKARGRREKARKTLGLVKLLEKGRRKRWVLFYKQWEVGSTPRILVRLK